MMRRLVLKFGGSSVATIDKIKRVAKIVIEHAQSAEVIVVVSAMQGETNRLLALAKKAYNPLEPNREFDQVLATGEVVSASLMALSLQAFGLKAVSMTGKQAGIQTNALHQNASIDYIDPQDIKGKIEQGVIPVITGFQGECGGDVTTLGRGGSDLTAIALAHALSADSCWIYTDVKGVFAVDPNIVENSDVFDQIGYKTLRQMAVCGAEVIQSAAIEYAEKYQVSVRVCSTFEPSLGTLVTHNNTFDKAIVVKCSGLVKIKYASKDIGIYQKLFEQKVVFSNQDYGLLAMDALEVKTKLNLMQDIELSDSICKNQTLISIFSPNEKVHKVLYEYLNNIDFVEPLLNHTDELTIKVLVPDYKMKKIVTDLYTLYQEKLERETSS